MSSIDVYKAYDILRRLDTPPYEPMPLAEDARLRERLFPYQPPEGVDDPERTYEKVLMEREVLGVSDLVGTVVRLPAVYGPHDPQHRLYQFLKPMLDGRPVILLDQAFEGWRWSRGYVENVAQAVVLAIEHKEAAGRVYNVADSPSLSLRQWVEAIGQTVGWMGEIVALPDEQLPEHRCLGYDGRQDWVVDTQRLRHELGFHEVVSFEEGMRRAVAWERNNPPDETYSAKFGYAAEDRALQHLDKTPRVERSC